MDTPLRILIIDDEENLRHMLSHMLTRQGYLVDVAGHGREGLSLLGERYYDFILCDIRMPEMDGTEFLAEVVKAGVFKGPVIMMSAYGSVDTAVECMKRGAYDFISKPFKKDEIVMVLKKAEERERLKLENRQLREQVAGESNVAGIITRNPVMLDLLDRIRKIASLKTTVLIRGESGTGKELTAQAIHRSGNRADKPCISVNCGAIPEALLESELFGHVRGAFTDAIADKEGLFAQADQGTLFLDEVAELSPSIQVKLLRVLQDGVIRPVGGQNSRYLDVRIISATSRDLEGLVAAGVFREDLYFRLNVFSIELPPLRERSDDVPLLAGHLLAKITRSMEHSPCTISSDAMRRLISSSWPGNIRELENVLHRAVILSKDSRITLDTLPPALHRSADRRVPTHPADDLSLKKAGALLEQDLIRQALEATGGNRTQAARILEISHRSLLYKLKEYHIE